MAGCGPGRAVSTAQSSEGPAGTWAPAPLTSLDRGAAWRAMSDAQAVLGSRRDPKVTLSQQLALLTLTDRKYFQIFSGICFLVAPIATVSRSQKDVNAGALLWTENSIYSEGTQGGFFVPCLSRY